MARGGVRQACWMLAAASLVAGAALWFMPPSPTVAPAPPLAIGAPVTGDTTSVNAATAEQIALGNLFSASRTPPSTRFVPPEFAGESASGMLTDPGSDTPAYSPMDTSGQPRLLGTVVGPNGPQALLQLGPATSPGSVRLYAPGDGDAGYRVISITPRVVVLRGPRGRVTLRLDQPEDRS